MLFTVLTMIVVFIGITLLFCLQFTKVAKRDSLKAISISNKVIKFYLNIAVVSLAFLIILAISIFTIYSKLLLIAFALTICLIFAYSFVYIYVLIYFHENLKGKISSYEPGGSVESWSDKSTNYLNSINWDENVFDNIKNSGLVHLSRSKDIKSILISVSANKAQHERKFLSMLNEYNVHFYCMDLAKIPEDYKIDSENFTYIKEEINALQLNQTRAEFNIPKADIIMDKKGCLWHSKKGKDAVEIDTFFENCYMSLNSNGSVIIDGAEQSSFLTGISYLIYKITGKIVYPSEGSTYSKIKEHIQNSSYFEEHFDKPVEVGDGQYRVFIIKKKD